MNFFAFVSVSVGIAITAAQKEWSPLCCFVVAAVFLLFFKKETPLTLMIAGLIYSFATLWTGDFFLSVIFVIVSFMLMPVMGVMIFDMKRRMSVSARDEFYEKG